MFSFFLPLMVNTREVAPVKVVDITPKINFQTSRVWARSLSAFSCSYFKIASCSSSERVGELIVSFELWGVRDERVN